MAGLLVVFLWRPLSSGGYYTPSDVLAGPLFNNFSTAKNYLLSDGAVYANPSVSWTRSQILHGHLPLWNPYNGAGAPHLGNGGSAVFSVFTLPYFLFSFRTALIVAPFLKLLVAGSGTCAFLRLSRVSRLAATVGAVAYMFSAYNIVWLSYTTSSVAVLVPWLIVFAHLTTEPRGSAPWPATVGLALTIGAVLVVGHPEAALFACVLAGGYIVRASPRSPDGRGQRDSFRTERFVVAWRAAVGVALGAGLSAVQILPFAEYFRHSASHAHRATAPPEFLDGRVVALHVFPKLLGVPTGYEDSYLKIFNFNTSVSFYIGALVLLLAGAGVLAFGMRRRFVPGFFVCVAALWALYAYNVAGFGTLVRKLPIAPFAIPDRGNFVWLFSLSVLAAYGLDALVDTNGVLHSKPRCRGRHWPGWLPLHWRCF